MDNSGQTKGIERNNYLIGGMNMANLFAWASIGENGKAVGGKKGDQTGREVKVGPYYNFGQDKCIRFRNVARGRKMSKVAKILANDNSAGYNQYDRVSLFNACKSYKWDFAKIKKAIKDGNFPKCNTDCSQFYATCVNIVYGKEKLPSDCTTRNLVKRCTVTNKANFKLTKNCPPKKWQKGDAPIKEGKHIIINV